jgi:uncharacterized protein (DUF2267 family)
MVLGVQTANAQKSDAQLAKQRPEMVAKAQVADLSKKLELNGDQQRAMFRAIVAKEVNYQKNVKGKDLKSAEVLANKKKIDAGYLTTVKGILTEKQFAMWQKMQNN